jgi:hypothetical protein
MVSASPTAKSLGWAIRRAGRPKPPLSPYVCSNAAAARSTPNKQARIQALPLSALEALADALLDFEGPEDHKTWLSDHAC